MPSTGATATVERVIQLAQSLKSTIMPEPKQEVGQQVAEMLTGYWISQSLHVAAKLELADRIADGPKSPEELARTVGADPRSLYRLLRALASVGVFAEDDQGRFGQTPMSEVLRRDVPGSKWAMAVMFGEEHYQAWGKLLDSVRTGQAGFDLVYGQPIFPYLAEHPEPARIFDAAMTSIHGHETDAILDSHDLSGIGTLADIGGGNGTTILGALRRHPSLKGLLFDLPGVIDRARPAIEAAGLADRCEAISGDFFQSVPPGADAYLLRHIIHDWDDNQSTLILRNVRQAMRDDSRVLIVESVVPPGNDPAFVKFLDLNMLALPGGLERTEDEYRRLFADAGLTLDRIVPTSGGVDVIEGRPA